MCFAIVESGRYGLQLCTLLGMKDTLVGRIFFHLRWNTFIVCYPIGAFSDMMCGVQSINFVGSTSPMIYSVSLPNAWNFSFNFYIFLHCLPILYVVSFPSIYKMLLKKRKENY